MKHVAVLLFMGLASSLAVAQDWRHEVHGSFPVFFIYSDSQGGEQGMRIM